MEGTCESIVINVNHMVGVCIEIFDVFIIVAGTSGELAFGRSSLNYTYVVYLDIEA